MIVCVCVCVCASVCVCVERCQFVCTNVPFFKISALLLYTHTHTHKSARAHTHTHSNTHAYTRAHTHHNNKTTKTTKQKTKLETTDVPLVDLMYFIFTLRPGESYRWRFRSLCYCVCVTSFERCVLETTEQSYTLYIIHIHQQLCSYHP